MLSGALVVAVVTDLKSRRIPNLLTFPAMALCLALRLYWEGLGDLTSGFLSGLAGLGAAVVWFGVFALSKNGMGWVGMVTNTSFITSQFISEPSA